MRINLVFIICCLRYRLVRYRKAVGSNWCTCSLRTPGSDFCMPPCQTSVRDCIKTNVFMFCLWQDHGLIINPEDRSLNLIKPPDWVLPHPDNESLTLARAVLLRHLDSLHTLPFCVRTGPHLNINYKS